MSAMTERPVEIRAKVTVSIDGESVEVLEGDTILDACNKARKDTPTVCYGPTVTPVNACRACVVEVEGNRTLVPSCSRPAEDEMVITTDSDRVNHSRKMVLEFLATSSDVTQAEDIMGWLGDYGADLDRYDDATTERMTDRSRSKTISTFGPTTAACFVTSVSKPVVKMPSGPSLSP